MGCFWGMIGETGKKLAVAEFRKTTHPSVCLQELALDFGDSIRRMQWADAPLVEGAATLKSLSRAITFLTGNPRYESLRPKEPVNGPVLINCNFTYGILENKRGRLGASFC